MQPPQSTDLHTLVVCGNSSVELATVQIQICHALSAPLTHMPLHLFASVTPNKPARPRLDPVDYTTTAKPPRHCSDPEQNENTHTHLELKLASCTWQRAKPL